jgi:Lrp/AsnC family transcriptional regulator, regulator for asnA, asnC and gidA
VKSQEIVPPDNLDLAILQQLQEDGRRSLREISKQLGVAPATVRGRVQQLIADKVVEIVAVPNPHKLGIDFHAALAIHLDPGVSDEVADLLAARDDTTWVGLAVTGCEVMCEIALSSSAEFAVYRDEVLRQLPGFRGVDVFLITDTRKFRYKLGGGSLEETSRKAVVL